MTNRNRRFGRAVGTLLLVCTVAACAGAGTTIPGLASLGTEGEFEVLTYSDFPDVPEFGDATIYYPVGTPGPIGGVVVAPGYTERQSHIEWWGPRLASHGYAVLVLDTNDPRERPDARADALLAAARVLRRENVRIEAPLFGRIAADRMALMGHSMGGGGVLLAAGRAGSDIRAAIPFTPWEPEADLGNLTVPTLVMAAEEDRIAPVAEHAWRHFGAIPSTTPKVYMEFDGADHFIADTRRGRDLDTVGRYALAWLALYLDGQERYREFLFGPRTAEDADKFSRYVVDP